METTTIMTQFRVEEPALKVSRRYRVVYGRFFATDEKNSFWIEIYIHSSRKWAKVYKYAHWDTSLEMMRSEEFYNVLYHVI